MKVGTFNLLHPEYAISKEQKKWKNFDNRKVKILKDLESADLDVVCLQEISKDRLEELFKYKEKGVKNLKDLGYTFRYGQHVKFRKDRSGNVKIGKDGKPEQISNPDSVAIIYKTAKFSEKDVRTREYEVEQSGGGAITAVKKHLFIDLEDNKTHEVTRIATCHLEGGKNRAVGDEQIETVKQLVEDMTTIKDNAYQVHQLVITGDFNRQRAASDNPDVFVDPGLKVLADDNYLDDRKYRVTEPSSGRQIDWIFYKALNGQTQKPKAIDIDMPHPDVSDHRMIASEIPSTLPEGTVLPSKAGAVNAGATNAGATNAEAPAPVKPSGPAAPSKTTHTPSTPIAGEPTEPAAPKKTTPPAVKKPSPPPTKSRFGFFKKIFSPFQRFFAWIGRLFR